MHDSKHVLKKTVRILRKADRHGQDADLEWNGKGKAELQTHYHKYFVVKAPMLMILQLWNVGRRQAHGDDEQDGHNLKASRCLLLLVAEQLIMR